MRHAILIAAALAVVACKSGGGGETRDAVAEPAPAVPRMQLKASDGKQHSLSELVARGPVFLYFVKKDCPTNNKALPYYEALYTGHGKPANFVAVVNLDVDKAAEWKAEHRASYPLLADPDLTWIHHFGAEASPWVVEVRRDGTPGRVWIGYGVTEIDELNAALAQTNGRKKATLDTTGLPKERKYG